MLAKSPISHDSCVSERERRRQRGRAAGKARARSHQRASHEQPEHAVALEVRRPSRGARVEEVGVRGFEQVLRSGGGAFTKRVPRLAGAARARARVTFNRAIASTTASGELVIVVSSAVKWRPMISAQSSRAASASRKRENKLRSGIRSAATSGPSCSADAISSSSHSESDWAAAAGSWCAALGFSPAAAAPSRGCVYSAMSSQMEMVYPFATTPAPRARGSTNMPRDAAERPGRPRVLSVQTAKGSRCCGSMVSTLSGPSGPDFEGLQRWGIFSSSTTHLAQQFPREMWFSTVALGLCVANVAALAPMRVSMSATQPLVRIGTRGSPLALAQAYETREKLQATFPEELGVEGAVELRIMKTQGDMILDKALSEIGGKGLFTKELDVALLGDEVDICVHSMKDVPTWLPEGTVLPCNMEREDTRDVFISPKATSISGLPDGSVIGSASLRRQAQILAKNPTLKVVNFRGNVQTRLRKLDEGVVDATLLAYAGLRRMNMADCATSILEQDEMLPAVAQGAIGIQCRSDDERSLRYIDALNHPATKVCVDCERAFLARLDGNCKTPIAGQARIVDGAVEFRGLVAKPDGSEFYEVTRSGSIEDAARIGDDAGLQIQKDAGMDFFTWLKQDAVAAD